MILLVHILAIVSKQHGRTLFWVLGAEGSPTLNHFSAPMNRPRNELVSIHIPRI